MSILVTGHQGFVGQYLLRQQGAVGLLAPGEGKAVDLLDAAGVEAAIAAAKPDAVVHLAAQSSVPEAFKDPVATYQSNFTGTHHLLAALKKTGFKGRFLYVSTAEVYGQTADAQLPISEQAPVAALNPYAVSKLAAETLCDYWNRVEGVDIVIARPFNHIGPGQSPRFAIADFAKSIIEVKLGLRPPQISVGDLDVTRDFTDVRDVVSAYMQLLAKAERGLVYNVCSGIERHMGEAVASLAALAGVQISLQQDPSRLRKASQRRSCGSSARLAKHTGWQPSIQWQQSLRDILNDWELKLK